MLLYHDKYPDRKPLQIQDLMEWTSQLVNGIAECLIKMRNCLNISNETVITKNTIIKYFDNGNFDKGLSLPENTPDTCILNGGKKTFLQRLKKKETPPSRRNKKSNTERQESRNSKRRKT